MQTTTPYITSVDTYDAAGSVEPPAGGTRGPLAGDYAVAGPGMLPADGPAAAACTLTR